MSTAGACVRHEAGGDGRDRVERLRGAVVQHGPRNDRAYLMKGSGDAESDIELLDGLARRHGYTKLFAKVPDTEAAAFETAGFETEAGVPAADRPFRFCSRFVDPSRRRRRDDGLVDRVLGKASSESRRPRSEATPELCMRPATVSHAGPLAQLYAECFESYPFPIDDPAFLEDSMRDGNVYVMALVSGRIAAAGAVEFDRSLHACEVTDLATREDRRGEGLATRCLERLEGIAAERAFSCAYTIARASSFGMNLVFARAGYRFGGTLVNNTHIGGSIESMNVWWRDLRARGDAGRPA